MRTTVTLDDDVTALLKRRQKEKGQGFKEALNGVLREALAAPRPARPARVRIRTLALGRLLVPNLDDVSEILEIAEGPGHR